MLPGTGKNFEQFQTDDAVCRQWALQQTGTTPNEAGAVGTVTGAAVGTAVGARARGRDRCRRGESGHRRSRRRRRRTLRRHGGGCRPCLRFQYLGGAAFRHRASQSGLAAGVHVVGRSAATTAGTCALTTTGVKRKVKQVLLNLSSKALKFTPKGGWDVGVRLHDHVAEVSGADTGIGIAPADQEAVFEEFRQVGTADKKAEGTGRGLALSTSTPVRSANGKSQ